MSTPAPERYAPLWVTLHWLTAILVLAAFYLGLSSFASPVEAKAAYLRWHMPIGLTVLVVTLIRIFIRRRVPRPEPIGRGFLDKAAEGVHHLLYVFLILVPLTGLGLSITYDLVPRVFGGGSVPENLRPLLHGLLNPLFMLVVLIHILAALYHQFIRRDRLLARMWYGQ